MKKQIIALLLGVFFSATSEFVKGQTAKSKSYSAAGKKVQVYTTAENSSQKLSAAADLVEFKEMGQPVETQICVFVDPDKTFQTFLGIVAH